VPHALVGAPTAPARLPAADLAMLGGIVLSVAGPLFWLGVVRPLFLRTRRHRRRHPIALPFGTTREPPWPPAEGTSWLREALNRSYLASLVWITVQLVAVFGLLVGPPWLAATLWPDANPTGVLALLGAALFLVGGPWIAVTIGAEPPRPYLRLRLALLGLLHGAMQLTLPLAILVYATPISAACVLGLWITVAAVATRMTRLPDREPAVRPWRIRAAVTALWLLQWLGAFAFLGALATRELPHQIGFWECVIAVLVGATICIHQLGWYLLVALLWGGHNNEAGAGVHCEDYKQWIRFHLGPDEVLTAYVIGVDRAADRAANPAAAVPAARLVDVFQLRPPG